jgi:hypothetical protein
MQTTLSRILTALLLLSCAAVSHAEQGFRTDVRLVVGKDDKIGGEVKSYVARELRGLGDVNVVDDGGEWWISTVTLTSVPKKGNGSGYVLSVVIYQQPRMEGFFDAHLDNDRSKSMARDLISGLVIPKGHWLFSCAPGDLRKTCAEIVTEFDTRCVTPARQAYEKTMKLLEKIKNRPAGRNDP